MENDQIYVSIDYNTSKNYRAAGKWNCLGGRRIIIMVVVIVVIYFWSSSCVPMLSLV